MGEKKLDLLAPQYIYEKKIVVMFAEDPEVDVMPLEHYTDTTYNLKIKVDNYYKAQAIKELLPDKVTFGTADVYIEVVSSNIKPRKIDLIKTAFEGNIALSLIKSSDDVFSNPISAWYKNIAKEVLGIDECIFYCTDAVDDCNCDEDYD